MNFNAQKAIFFLVLSIFQPFSSFAAIEDFKVKGDQFKIEVPAGWQTANDFYGIPVTLLGPDNEEKKRTVIGITPVGYADTARAFDKGDPDVKAYMSGREEWLKTFDGKAISYDPYQKITWPGIEEAHALGYHYELPSGKFYERSLFVFCGGRRLYHIKTITHSNHENTDNALVDKTLKTLSCVAAATEKSRKVK